MSSAGSRDRDSAEACREGDAPGATLRSVARRSPSGTATEPPAEAAVSVILVTVNQVFGQRLTHALQRSARVRMNACRPPASGTTLQRLAAGAERPTLVVDAELFLRGAIVAGAGTVDPHDEPPLLLAFHRVERDAVEATLAAHAHGCVEYDIAPDNFVRAVEAVASGEFWFPRWMTEPLYAMALSYAEQARAARAHPALSSRESEVMALVRRGLTNKQIARELDISPNTVKKHVHTALSKLGFLHRRQAF